MKKLLLLVVLGLLLVGCAKEETKEVTEAKKNEMVESFLTEVFTLNKDDRYETLMETVLATEIPPTSGETTGVQEAPEEVKQAYAEYYKSFENLATEQCLESMRANRIPIKYDALIPDEGVSGEIAELKLEKTGENSYSFEATYDADITAIKGKVTLKMEGEQVYVNSIDIY